MKNFGFCVSLVTEDLTRTSSPCIVSMNYRTRGVKCVEVVDRYMAGLVLGRWVGTHSRRLDRTVNGQDVNSTSGIHSWNLGQSTTRLRDLRCTINRFVTVEYPTHRSAILSIVHGDGFCALWPVLSLNSDFHFLVYPRPPISCRTASSSTFLKDGYRTYTFFRAKKSRHASFSTIIAYVMLI